MKLRKNFLKISILALILACVMIASTMFASGTNTANEDSNTVLLELIVDEGEIKANEPFTATVKVANTSLEGFDIAGLQVTLNYDSSKITATSVNPQLDEDSTTAYNISDDGSVKFACVKNDFQDGVGYTSLSDLFTVTFTAEQDITPSECFEQNCLSDVVIGNTLAKEIASEGGYTGSLSDLAKALLNLDGSLVFEKTTVTSGTKDIVLLSENYQASKFTTNDFTVTKDGNNVTGNVGTGSIIKNADSDADVTVVVKGDLDGDGVVTVFDAMILKKANDANGTGDNAFTDNRFAEKAAGDFDGNGSTEDVESILGYIVEK